MRFWVGDEDIGVFAGSSVCENVYHGWDICGMMFFAPAGRLGGLGSLKGKGAAGGLFREWFRKVHRFLQVCILGRDSEDRG